MAASAREPKGIKYVQKKSNGKYGLSAELQKKQDAKYDIRLEHVIREWIQEVTGKPLGYVEEIEICVCVYVYEFRSYSYG